MWLDPNTTIDTSETVRRLDAFLNVRIVSGSLDQQRRWWAVKCRAKQHLARLPPSEVCDAAAEILRTIISEAA